MWNQAAPTNKSFDEHPSGGTEGSTFFFIASSSAPIYDRFGTCEVRRLNRSSVIDQSQLFRKLVLWNSLAITAALNLVLNKRTGRKSIFPDILILLLSGEKGKTPTGLSGYVFSGLN